MRQFPRKCTCGCDGKIWEFFTDLQCEHCIGIGRIRSAIKVFVNCMYCSGTGIYPISLEEFYHE